MHARFLHLGFLLRRGGEALQNAGWEGEWMDDERLCPPREKGILTVRQRSRQVRILAAPAEVASQGAKSPGNRKETGRS